MTLKMSAFRYICLALAFTFSIMGCKPAHENAEKGYLQVQPLSAATSTPMAYCFDQINGLAHGNLPDICVDSGGMYYLPLNISSDSCTFIFTKDKRNDTVHVKYRRSASLILDEYLITYPALSISGNTFLSSKSSCTHSKCDAENFILYLYY